MELLPHVSLLESLDDTDLPSLDFDAVSSFVDAALKEKLTLSREATAIVASVVHPHLETNGYEFVRCDEPHRTRPHLQRLELPALFTDHELDVASFKIGSLERIKIDLPLEKVNEENDEGLGFTEAFCTSADEVKLNARSEKLDATKEIIALLQDVRGWGKRNTGECPLSLLGEFRNRKKLRGSLTPITPPLVSETSTPEPFKLSSPSRLVPLVSEPVTPEIPLHARAQQFLLTDDKASPPDCTKAQGKDGNNVLREYLLGPPQTSRIGRGVLAADVLEQPHRKQLAMHAKIEVPITPPVTIQKHRQGHQKGSTEGPLKVDASLITPLTPCPLGDLGDSMCADGLDEELAAVAQKALGKVRDKLNREVLRSIPPSTRLIVPVLEQVSITSPWDTQAFKKLLSRSCSKLEQTQLSLTKVEKRLSWEWFNPDITVPLDDPIASDGILYSQLLDAEMDGLMDYGGFLYVTQGIGRLSDCLAKYDEINIFGQDAEESSSKSPPEEDMANLKSLRDKKVMVTSQKLDHSCPSKRKPRDLGHPPKARKTEKVRRPSNEGSQRIKDVPFSAMDSLAQFMSLRGKKSETVKSKDSHLASQPTKATHSLQKTEHGATEFTASTGTALVPFISPEIPDFPAPEHPSTLVLSTSLLKTHRDLVRALEDSPRQLHLLFRDYDAHSRMKHLHEPPEQEADIIMFPQTGILLTNVQDITQKYLPGQEPKNSFAVVGNPKSLTSPLRTRIATISLRYEELYVLVCHMPSKVSPVSGFSVSLVPESGVMAHSGRGTSGPAVRFLDERSSMALTSFTAFCASLVPQASIIPVVVSPASTDVIAGWIRSLAYKHHRNMPWTTGQYCLPVDVTNQELFLRRAGLNPLAALLVLHEDALQRGGKKRKLTGGGFAAEDETMVKGEAERFTEFVTMSPFERKRKYELILGANVIDRVERALEMEW